MALTRKEKFIRSTILLVILLVLLITTIIFSQKITKYKSSAKDLFPCNNVGEVECSSNSIIKCISYKQGNTVVKVWTTIKVCSGGTTCVGYGNKRKVIYTCTKEPIPGFTPLVSSSPKPTFKPTPTLKPKSASTPKPRKLYRF